MYFTHTLLHSNPYIRAVLNIFEKTEFSVRKPVSVGCQTAGFHWIVLLEVPFFLFEINNFQGEKNAANANNLTFLRSHLFSDVETETSFYKIVSFEWDKDSEHAMDVFQRAAEKVNQFK